MIQSIVLFNPFNAHGHWRQQRNPDGKRGMLYRVGKFTTDQYAGGLLMPNTKPNITSLEHLLWYRGQIFAFLKFIKSDFMPIFTFYLSPELKVEDIREAWKRGLFHAVKYYPEGGTTNSDKGLAGFSKVRAQLEVMQELNIPLLIHGEIPKLNGEVVGDFKREKMFLDKEMSLLCKEFPELRAVMEHITIKASAQFVLEHDNVWATVTPQGCLLDDRALFNSLEIINKKPQITLKTNGMQPAKMCRPIIKDIEELLGIQAALIRQAIEGLEKIGLGDDTAPWLPKDKYKEACACGMFNAPLSLQMYAMAFEQMNILHHLPIFACDIMPKFYGIKDILPKKIVTIHYRDQYVEQKYNGIVPPFAGETIPYSIEVEA